MVCTCPGGQAQDEQTRQVKASTCAPSDTRGHGQAISCTCHSLCPPAPCPPAPSMPLPLAPAPLPPAHAPCARRIPPAHVPCTAPSSSSSRLSLAASPLDRLLWAGTTTAGTWDGGGTGGSSATRSPAWNMSRTYRSQTGGSSSWSSGRSSGGSCGSTEKGGPACHPCPERGGGGRGRAAVSLADAGARQ